MYFTTESVASQWTGAAGSEGLNRGERWGGKVLCEGSSLTEFLTHQTFSVKPAHAGTGLGLRDSGDRQSNHHCSMLDMAPSLLESLSCFGKPVGSPILQMRELRLRKVP